MNSLRRKLVAEPTACQDDNQQCWHPKADEGGQVSKGCGSIQYSVVLSALK